MHYLGNLAQGNLGNSLRTSEAVGDVVLLRLPMTVELAFSAMLIASIVGITLGIISAYWNNSAYRRHDDDGRQPGRLDACVLLWG